MDKLFCATLMLLLLASISNAADTNPQELYLNVPTENLRLTPNGKKIGTFLHGTQLRQLEKKGEWVHIQVDGWVWEQSLSKEKPSPLNKNSSTLSVESWKWVNKNSRNLIKIDGIIKNNADMEYKSIKMQIFARDADGNFLGTATASLQPSSLPSGGSSMFSAIIEDAICPTHTIDISYKFEVR